MKAIIAAAGTGGHINPGIAIANKIKQMQPNSEIIFIGTGRGLDKDLVPRAGYELKTIQSYGIDRRINLDNIRRTWKTLYSIHEAKRILKEFKPDVVIGTGGYISLSVGIAAKSQRIPLLMHESNAFPGISVKLLSKKIDTILLGFEDAKQRLPKAKSIVVTGNPIQFKKIAMSEEKKEVMKLQLGFNSQKPLVLVFGGSQGAQSINKSITHIIKNGMNKNYQLIWAAGAEQYEETKQELERENIKIDAIENTKIVPYIYNMEEIMNSVDLVVCRSGAMTISEIALLGKPAIFIPFPYASENHQEYNARVLEKVGAAKIILDKELTAENLQNEIDELVKDKKNLYDMGKKAEQIAKHNVEKQIYEQIKKYVK